MSETKATPPPNPFFKREYVWSMKSGYATFEIPAPGGRFDADDAPGLIEFMQMIIRQLERRYPVDPQPNPSERSAG